MQDRSGAGRPRSAAEIDAIARHEHLSRLATLEMGACLSGMPEGKLAVWRMILEDIQDARRRGDTHDLAPVLS
jgi:hypothetical protein